MPHSFTAFLQRCLSSQQRCGASRRRRTHGDAGLASATTHLELSTLCLSPHHLPPHHRPSFRRTTS
uniref:Uncharacterized protein n=1 Tax=Oryza barthii TaxID=65489 RepID=A0A0D3FUZ6_9ORYZ